MWFWFELGLSLVPSIHCQPLFFLFVVLFFSNMQKKKELAVETGNGAIY